MVIFLHGDCHEFYHRLSRKYFIGKCRIFVSVHAEKKTFDSKLCVVLRSVFSSDDRHSFLRVADGTDFGVPNIVFLEFVSDDDDFMGFDPHTARTDIGVSFSDSNADRCDFGSACDFSFRADDEIGAEKDSTVDEKSRIAGVSSSDRASDTHSGICADSVVASVHTDRRSALCIGDDEGSELSRWSKQLL